MKAVFRSAGHYDKDRVSVTIELIGTVDEIAVLVEATLHCAGREVPATFYTENEAGIYGVTDDPKFTVETRHGVGPTMVVRLFEQE